MRFIAVGAAVALIFAACGGGDDDDEQPAAPSEQDTPAVEDNGDENGGGTGEASPLLVLASEFEFDPNEISIPPGTQVSVTLRNVGTASHTFTIDELDVDTGTVGAGQAEGASFTMPEEEVTFFCTVHGADTMSGTLIPSG
ncbi:MAG: cupredoxin domain-containing protein [Actinomycetota bacterium]